MHGYERNILSDWDKVRAFSDKSYSYRPSYLERAVQSNLPPHVFTAGQIASKAWLMNNFPFVQHENPVIAMLGCWVGTLVEPVIDFINPSRVYGFDLEPSFVSKAEKFNQKHVQNDWKFKGVVADVNTLDTSNMKFETGGELITVSPDIIINTSTEHMENDWFNTTNKEQLIIMQSNSSKEEDDHINTCENIEEFFEKYPMNNIMYAGEMITPSYTRFMQIGTK